MSASSALQAGIYAALQGDAALTSLVSGRVYDVPMDGVSYPHISFGPSSFTPERRDCITSRTEVFQIDVWARDGLRQQPCKAIVDTVVDLLDQPQIALADPYSLARMELVLSRVVRDPDGITTHGVVQFECEVEGG